MASTSPASGNSTLPAPIKPTPQSASALLFAFFTPSFDLAIVGSAAFTALAVIHVGLLVKSRAWNFNLIPQAALMLATSMIVRLIVIAFPQLAPTFVISFLTLMISGSLVPIQLMFTYTRLIWWITPSEHRNLGTLWLPPRATSVCLVAMQSVADVIGTLGSGMTFLLQNPRIAAVGAVLELLVWIVFFMLVTRFTFMSRSWSMSEKKRQGSLELGLALSVSAFLIVVRGIMQVLEKDALQTLLNTFKATSIVITKEWPTWVFDILPLFLVLAITTQYHPGFILPKRLMGFRLNTRGLLKDDRNRDIIGEDSRALSAGWNISRPVPNVNNGPNVIVIPTYADQIKYPVGYAE